jgi:ABC-type oligopeptide transport system substrate-binding subunit
VKKRLEMLSKAEGILLDEAPIINVYNYVNKYMFRPNVKGVSLHSRNMVMFKAVYVER